MPERLHPSIVGVVLALAATALGEASARRPLARSQTRPAAETLVLRKCRVSIVPGPTGRLGSQADNDVVLAFGGIQPLHAEIRLEEGRYVIYDRSEGQVWVNARPIAGRNLLKDGFTIRLGEIDLVFRQ